MQITFMVTGAIEPQISHALLHFKCCLEQLQCIDAFTVFVYMEMQYVQIKKKIDYFLYIYIRKILPGSHCLIQQDTVAKHNNYTEKQQKQTKKTSSRKFPAQHRSRLSRSTPPLHQNLQL